MTDNGTNGNKRTVILSLISACIPLIPTVMVAAFYQVSMNEKLTASSDVNSLRIKNLQDAIYGLNTPLAAKVLRLEDRQEENNRVWVNLSTRVETMDRTGTRANSFLVTEQMRMSNQIERISDRMLLFDQRLTLLEAAFSQLREQLGLTTQKSQRRN